MEMAQEIEWKEAQSTVININLVSAAKRQLQFLAAVDRKRWLYEGQGLDRAIFRYNTYWLPLLAKHSQTPLFEGSLVVPFDCEWIWHCHRLNPVRYKSDCEEFCGRILDNYNVLSTVGGTSTRESEQFWKLMYPDEPFELDMSDALHDKSNENMLGERTATMYDLVSAVQRQVPFFYQVSRPHMNDDRYLEGAVARYKGFLHLIKRNNERSIRSFSVPTYDIDLIWHTHQLHPASYCNELVAIMGKVLEHDDTDSDRTEGQKLDVGFSKTTRNWEELYGSRYWRAGAMYRGHTPSPVRATPCCNILTKNVTAFKESKNIVLPHVEVLEVLLEIVDVRNLPEEYNINLMLSFSKTQHDAIFNSKRSLKIFTESGKRSAASFNCEPSGLLVFELSCLLSSLPLSSKSFKTLGHCSVSLQDFLAPGSSLTLEKWLEFIPTSKFEQSEPVGLRLAISVTIPTPAPYALRMICSQPVLKSSCLFSAPPTRRVLSAKTWTRVVDEAGNSVISLKIRDSKRLKGKKTGVSRELAGIMQSGETRTLAEYTGSKWSFVNSTWNLQFPNAIPDDGHLLELCGPQNVRFFLGGRLDYEPTKHCADHERDVGFKSHLVTAIEFSAKHPYGRAVALLDLKAGTIKVKEEWFLLPGILLTFMLGNMLRKMGNSSILAGVKMAGKRSWETSHKELEACKEITTGNAPVKGGAFGGGCGGGCGGSGCGSMAMCGGCGGCGAGGCGSMTGCGCGCGGMEKKGGCGGCGGCGGGCGSYGKTMDCDYGINGQVNLDTVTVT